MSSDRAARKNPATPTSSDIRPPEAMLAESQITRLILCSVTSDRISSIASANGACIRLYRRC